MTPSEFESGVNNILDSTKPKGVDGSKGITKAIFKQIVVFFKNLLTETINTASSAGYKDLTSVTSITIGTGSKTFTTNKASTSSAFIAGLRVRVINTTTPTRYMEGVITSFSGTTLVVNVDYVAGSGTYAVWDVAVAGQKGIDGSNSVGGTQNFLQKLNSNLAFVNSLFYDNGQNIGIGTASPVNNGSGSTGLTIDGTGGYTNLTLLHNGQIIGTIVTNFNSGLNIGSETGFLSLSSNGVQGCKLDENQNLLLGTNSGVYKFTLNGEPGANGYTAFTNYSDARLKENVLDLNRSELINRFMKLRPVTFNYNKKSGYDKKTRSRTIGGFVAQELKEIFPEMVGSIMIKNKEYYDTNLSNLPLYSVMAIQELSKQIELLKLEIKLLKN